MNTDTTQQEAPVTEGPARAKKNNVSFVASVKLTVLSLSLIAATVLVGAWCPQETQVGRDKVFEAFGDKYAPILIQMGISDIFHTPWFLFLIALITLNMVACSFQRVFPKVRLLRQPMPFLKGVSIEKMPFVRTLNVGDEKDSSQVVSKVEEALRKSRYKVLRQGDMLVGDFGKVGRLAATVTHIGLLTLVGGVTVTSWTGFSGFQPVKLEESMSFADSQHSKLWIGSLPDWTVRVNKTWKESYPGGEPKQWYSDLSVVSAEGKEMKRGTISVNNPLTYDGVDIYQASWGIDSLELLFNGQAKQLPLETMGTRHAAFLPLDRDSVLIFSASDKDSSEPLRIFAKRSEWKAPKKIAEVKPGEAIDMGGVKLTFSRLIPRTGLQYKKDPAIGVVFVAFGFIIVGVLLAAIPFRQVWVSVEPLSRDGSQFAAGDVDEKDLKQNDGLILYIGGRSVKAKVGFERSINKLLANCFGDSMPDGVEEKSPLDQPEPDLKKETV